MNHDAVIELDKERIRIREVLAYFKLTSHRDRLSESNRLYRNPYMYWPKAQLEMELVRVEEMISDEISENDLSPFYLSELNISLSND